jgi:Cys-tRNA(Pro)/Cys-tRNA(Cys) deacylase
VFSVPPWLTDTASLPQAQRTQRSHREEFPTDRTIDYSERTSRILQAALTLNEHFMTQKTNAVRLLDQLGIEYELRAYEVDPNDLTAESVAEKVGLPPEQVFKTLVARGDRRGICMAVIPGDVELDLKSLANASGDRKIHLVQMKELLGLTGYIRGGVTAFAGKKDYPVYVDETLELFDVVSISAGIRGLQVLLKPEDYLRVTKGTIAALTTNL